MDQAELGVGRPMNINRLSKRVLSPSGKTLQIAEMMPPLPPLPKKRVTPQATLTPDNAEGVVRNSFNLTMFSESLMRQPETVQDLEALLRLMTQCVVDQTVLDPRCPFNIRYLIVFRLCPFPVLQNAI